MDNHQSVTIDCKWALLILPPAFLLYAIVLVDLFNSLPSGAVVFGAYSLLGLWLIYVLWASSIVIRINKDGFVVCRLFGLGRSSNLRMENVRRLLIRSNCFDRVTRVVVEFTDDQQLQFHQYQRNFEVARGLLSDHLSAVPRELQSKWAL